MTNFEGHPDRECGEHRAYATRAYCLDCSMWCYPDIEMACRGCELPALRHQIERLGGTPHASGRRRRVNDEFKRRIAEIYLANLDDYPAQAVARYLKVDPRKAAKYLAAAQAAGYLRAPAGPGQNRRPPANTGKAWGP